MKSAAILLLVVMAGCATTRTNHPASKVSLEVTCELQDGSRIKGVPSIQSLSVRTEYARLKIKLVDVKKLSLDKNGETVKLETRNGDTVTGVLDMPQFRLRTLVGDLPVKAEQLVTMTVQVAGAGQVYDRLVLHYDFESAENDIIADVTGSGRYGQRRNVEIVEDAEKGSVGRFTGEGSYVSFPDKGLPDGNSARTVTLWFQTKRQSLRQVMFLYGRYHPGDEMHLLIYENQEVITLGNWGGGGEFHGRQIVADGQWHHVALVYDGDGTAKVYVDGRLDLKKNRTYQTMTGGTGYVSFRYDGHGFKGLMDDFMVFDRALDAGQIATLYNAQNPSHSTTSKR